MTIIEGIAALFGLICVWLTIRENVWCWPTGIVQVVLYIYIFYQVRLYSDVILQMIFVPLSIYGWYNWLHGSSGEKKTVITKTGQYFWIWVIVSFAGAYGLGFVMKNFTNASLPYPDSFILVASLIAQWLMAQKKVESWFFWIGVDVVAIVVYLMKGLYFTTVLYFVFLALAIIGYMEWRKVFFQLTISTSKA